MLVGAGRSGSPAEQNTGKEGATSSVGDGREEDCCCSDLRKREGRRSAMVKHCCWAGRRSWWGGWRRRLLWVEVEARPRVIDGLVLVAHKRTWASLIRARARGKAAGLEHVEFTLGMHTVERVMEADEFVWSLMRGRRERCWWVFVVVMQGRGMKHNVAGVRVWWGIFFYIFWLLWNLGG